MAVSCELLTYPDHTFTPQDFSIMLERVSMVKTGIMSGCEVAAVIGSTNQVSVSAGWVAVRGRLVKLESGTLSFTLPQTGTATRYVLVTVNLENTSSPATVTVENSMPSDETTYFNEQNGKAYCVLATIDTSTLNITQITRPEFGTRIDTVIPVSNGQYGSGWTSVNNAIVNDLTVQGVTADTNQDIVPSYSITEEQLEAMQEANIVCVGQSANTIRLRAFGDTPSIDLPVTVILRGQI